MAQQFLHGANTPQYMYLVLYEQKVHTAYFFSLWEQPHTEEADGTPVKLE
jgi:hypothetical protein